MFLGIIAVVLHLLPFDLQRLDCFDHLVGIGDLRLAHLVHPIQFRLR
jgi:hypothetical protein